MDKIKHFIACFIPTAILGLYGLSGSIGIAVTKEWCDSRTEGNKWDWWDIFFDFLGTCAGLYAHYMFGLNKIIAR